MYVYLCLCQDACYKYPCMYVYFQNTKDFFFWNTVEVMILFRCVKKVGVTKHFETVTLKAAFPLVFNSIQIR